MMKGFTLAELLLAIAILGVIAIFTIPKIITSQQTAQKMSLFQEALAALSTITYEGQITRDLTGTIYDTYVLSRVNAVKICSTDADTEGCWTQATPGGSAEQKGYVLSNGVTVAGLDTGSTSGSGYREAFFMDYNGTASPNTEGTDQIRLRACWGSGNCSAGQRPGTVVAEPGQATSITMYETIFAH